MINLEEFDSTNKRDITFQLVVAMRDTIAIAKKTKFKPTYENSIQLFHDFNPELYEEIIDTLPQRNISDEAKMYIAKAEIKTNIEKEKIYPIDLLEDDIKELESYLDNENISHEDEKLFNSRVGTLQRLKKSLKPRKINENRILQRDFSKVDRKDFGASFIDEDDFYIDYKLKGDKYLRIRLLHPDMPEHTTGADLIYEQHNVKEGLIRVLFLQYKIWDDGVLYFSQAKNLEAQLGKMKECLCDKGFCDKPLREKKDEALTEYRFPYCCAFLRPTDKLQEQNEKLVSSGIHIPICAVERIKEIEGGIINRRYIRHQALTHDIFEHLFNRNFIGSRWLREEQVEEMYREHNILNETDSIKIYAREILDSPSDNVDNVDDIPF